MKTLVAALVFTSCLTTSGVRASTQDDDWFESQVRPLLVERCSECHAGGAAEGGLSLDTREDLLKGGDSGRVIDLAQPEKSLLLSAVRRSGELAMPPDDPLTQQEVETLASWIEGGASWPEANHLSLAVDLDRAKNHWAFQSIDDPTVPNVSSEQWLQNPIDGFVLSRLEQAGIEPAQPADRRTLIRRISYVLTGLPPTPDRVEAFVQSDDPHAYEKLVDELLSSEQYGVHWARHWLDIARYSDTKGYVYGREERTWVHAWTYRDWVVEALNDDMPYERFLRFQLAAEQMDDAEKRDLAAMGFLTLGRRFLGVPWDIIDDRIDTVTRTTLGLTVGCARCHNHKYDPIPTADYYSLYGVFASSEERLVSLLGEEEDNAASSELHQRLQTLEEKRNEYRTISSERARSRVGDYLHAQTELEKYPPQGFDQLFGKDDLLPAFVWRWNDFLHQADREQDLVFVAWRRFQDIPEDSFAELAVTTCKSIATMNDDQINPLVREAFSIPPTSFDEVVERYGELFRVIDLQWKESLRNAEEAGAEVPGFLDDESSEAIRSVLYGRHSPCEVPNLPVVHIETFFETGVITELWKLQGEVDRWIISQGGELPHALTLSDREVAVEPRVFRRGDPTNLGEDVPRQFLAVLSGTDRDPFQYQSGRAEMARAIVDEKNPLTARVMVNRVWAHYFGKGLVLTPSDFGLRSAPPSHPQLLDWLATRFVEEGWSLKKLHRRIALSNTFRQASSVAADSTNTERALQADPENRLLWRMREHRMSFEEFRDSLIAASGGLSFELGGPSANLFAAPFPDRRTLYGTIDRQFLPSTLRVFDFANPDLHIPSRSETTVPQQALFLLNHPMMIERVQELAAVAEEKGNPESIVRELFHRVLQRPPTSLELAESLQFVELAEMPEEREQKPTVADWQYGYGALDEESKQTTGFTALPHFTGTSWQGGEAWPDSTLGWVQLTATGGHPGNDRQHASIRRWTSPEKQTIQIRSTLINEPEQGDGIRAHVVSSKQGLLETVKNHQEPVEVNVLDLSVEAGETIDFIVDIDEVLNNDQYLWEVSIRSNEHETVWNSKDDFTEATVRHLNGWEQLAQALLCTNEFMFIE